jgi:hypothetical protein
MSRNVKECLAPSQGAELDKIRRFVGSWRASAKMWSAPDQEPVTSTGTMINGLIFDGRYLELNYRQDDNEFEGRGFWGFNPGTGQYESFWIDSGAPMMMFDPQGSVSEDGEVYESIGHVFNPKTGKPMRKRSVTTWLNDDEHTYEMFFGEPGEEFKSLEVRYTRA